MATIYKKSQTEGEIINKYLWRSIRSGFAVTSSSEANRINQDISSDGGVLRVTSRNNAQSSLVSLRLVSSGKSLPFSKGGNICRRNLAGCSVMSHINVHGAELHSTREDLKLDTKIVLCLRLQVLEVLGDCVATVAIRSLEIPGFDKVNMKLSDISMHDAILQVVVPVVSACCIADLGHIDGRWKPRSQKSCLKRRIQHSIACRKSHVGR